MNNLSVLEQKLDQNLHIEILNLNPKPKISNCICYPCPFDTIIIFPKTSAWLQLSFNVLIIQLAKLMWWMHNSEFYKSSELCIHHMSLVSCIIISVIFCFTQKNQLPARHFLEFCTILNTFHAIAFFLYLLKWGIKPSRQLQVQR